MSPKELIPKQTFFQKFTGNFHDMWYHNLDTAMLDDARITFSTAIQVIKHQIDQGLYTREIVTQIGQNPYYQDKFRGFIDQARSFNRKKNLTAELYLSTCSPAERAAFQLFNIHAFEERNSIKILSEEDW